MPPNPPVSPLGEIIRRQREVNRLSMRQFAEMAGISNPYLSQIERGLREPSEKVVDAIARSLQMTADALYQEAGIAASEEPEDAGVRAAVEADSQLTGRQRRALLEVYDAFLAVNGVPRHRRRRAAVAAMRAVDGPDPVQAGNEDETG
jgi:transcriptional regulator with XRE-family HTH domain